MQTQRSEGYKARDSSFFFPSCLQREISKDLQNSNRKRIIMFTRRRDAGAGVRREWDKPPLPILLEWNVLAKPQLEILLLIFPPQCLFDSQVLVAIGGGEETLWQVSCLWPGSIEGSDLQMTLSISEYVQRSNSLQMKGQQTGDDLFRN